MSAKDAAPLSVPLSHVLGGLTAELEAHGGNVPSLAMWSVLLRCIGDGITDRSLPEVACISSRFATAAINRASTQGWINAEPTPGAKKTRLLQLTDAGRAATKTWRQRLDAQDALWARTPLRSALEELVAQLPFELPHFPVSYGNADPSAIGGPYAQQLKRTEGVPAHANDWKPVKRADGDTVSELSIIALLSQALMAFTIDYEDRFPWPLTNIVNVLAHLGEEPRPLDELPDGHGIAGNGKSLTERHLITKVTKEGKRQLVALTDRGVLVMRHHPQRLAAVATDWNERFGPALIRRLTDALTKAGDGLPGPQPDHLMVSAP